VFDGVPQEAWELEGSEYDESLEAEVEEGSREWRDEERLTSLRRVAAQEQTRDDEAGREKERKQAEAWLRSQLGMGLEEEEGVGAHTHMQRKGGGVVTETAVADVGAGSGLRGEEDDEDDVMVGTGWGLEVAVSSDILFLVRKEEGDEADVMMEAMTEGKWDEDAEQWGAVERDLDAKIQQQVEHELEERVQYWRDADDEEEWNDRQWETDRDELMFGADGSGRDDDDEGHSTGDEQDFWEDGVWFSSIEEDEEGGDVAGGDEAGRGYDMIVGLGRRSLFARKDAFENIIDKSK